MAFKDTMNKVKDFFLKDGKRNLIITCAIVLIGAAVWLNFIFFANNDEGGFDYTGNTGMSGELDNSKNPTNDNSTSTGSDSYFATVQVSRQRAREEALEVLNAVIENDKATDAIKAEAVEEIKKISLEMEQEADIESLIVSKGFEQCVAVVNGETASIVVKCSGKLTPTQLAQINASVYEITGIEPINITIVGRE
ncbi:MAG: SpoIIIAH-like family protein [Clostridia bacterium]|nr:SpoIIIAH-like family protein [Clostridia bacterium]